MFSRKALKPSHTAENKLYTGGIFLLTRWLLKTYRFPWFYLGVSEIKKVNKKIMTQISVFYFFNFLESTCHVACNLCLTIKKNQITMWFEEATKCQKSSNYFEMCYLFSYAGCSLQQSFMTLSATRKADPLLIQYNYT